MTRDILAISGGLIALGVVMWSYWGNPVNPPSTQIAQQQLVADPDLKLISERSPYMRNER